MGPRLCQPVQGMSLLLSQLGRLVSLAHAFKPGGSILGGLAKIAAIISTYFLPSSARKRSIHLHWSPDDSAWLEWEVDQAPWRGKPCISCTCIPLSLLQHQPQMLKIQFKDLPDRLVQLRFNSAFYSSSSQIKLKSPSRRVQKHAIFFLLRCH